MRKDDPAESRPEPTWADLAPWMPTQLSDVMNTLELRRSPRASEEKTDAKEPPSPSVEESAAERECNSAREAQAMAQEAVDAAEEAARKSSSALEASGADVARVEARLKEAEKEMARLKRKIERCVAENSGSNEDEGSDEEEQARQAATAAALKLINKKELDEVRTLFKPPQVAPTAPPPTRSRHLAPRAAAEAATPSHPHPFPPKTSSSPATLPPFAAQRRRCVALSSWSKPCCTWPTEAAGCPRWPRGPNCSR